MSTVANILAGKHDELWCLTPDNTVHEAVTIMNEKNVGALMVMDEQKLVGIISERDFTRKVILQERSPKETLVKDIMTREVRYVHPDQSVETCLALITEHRVRHLPVLEKQKMVGMISIGDVVKHVISDQKVKIDHLEQVLSWGESY